MVSHLFFYQLMLIALVWLCLMLHWAWPSDPAACPTRKVQTKKDLSQSERMCSQNARSHRRGIPHRAALVWYTSITGVAPLRLWPLLPAYELSRG
jgi:hypothetical protein